MGFPNRRLRRLRKNENIRRMVRENRISVDDLIYPMFVVHGEGIKEEINSLPNNYHFSVDCLVEETKKVQDLGIPAILLFGIPQKKDPLASESYNPNGIIQQSVFKLKKQVPELLIISDVCLSGYTDHGHSGIIENGIIHNDMTVEILRKIALSHAEVGSDIIAPSAMMDGQIGAIRNILDVNNFSDVNIMGYSAKFASNLYEPFRKDGAKSNLTIGDKKTYQMDFANSNEAMREIALDIEEGADIIIVKPGMFYLDIVYRARAEFDIPIAVYNVSGEYVMINSAAQLGKINEEAVIMEVMTGFKRAGADLIITYYAKEITQYIG